MSVVAVYNLKGGVGKTATAVILAYLSARGGYRTLLWDLDPQGASSFCYRIRPVVKGAEGLVAGALDLHASIRSTEYDRLHLLPADFSYRGLARQLDATSDQSRRLRRVIEPLARSYDHLFIDCPDSLNTLSEGIFCMADLLLVPVIPTVLALRTLAQVDEYLKLAGGDHAEVVPFLSMVDRRKRMHREILDSYAGRKLGFLRAAIPFASEVENMGLRRAPLPSYDRSSRAALAFEALWSELLPLLEVTGIVSGTRSRTPRRRRSRRRRTTGSPPSQAREFPR